jgi:hypothetical protein
MPSNGSSSVDKFQHREERESRTGRNRREVIAAHKRHGAEGEEAAPAWPVWLTEGSRPFHQRESESILASSLAGSAAREPLEA